MKKLLFWIPRITVIIVIAFMFVFSMDVFEGDEPVARKLLGFLMHNIPALILAAATVIAWKWELVGGILLIVLFLASCWLFRSFQGNPGSLAVTSPVLVAGVLFVLSFARTRKKRVRS